MELLIDKQYLSIMVLQFKPKRKGREGALYFRLHMMFMVHSINSLIAITPRDTWNSVFKLFIFPGIRLLGPELRSSIHYLCLCEIHLMLYS